MSPGKTKKALVMSPIFSPENLTISEMILRIDGDMIDFEDGSEIEDVAGSAIDGLRWSRQIDRLVAARRQFWIVDADARTQSGPIRVTVNVAAPVLSAVDIARIDAFIAQLDAMQPAIEATLAKTLHEPQPNVLRGLIVDLHGGLDPHYWTQLFGQDRQPDAVTGADIFAACRCVALQFNLPGVPRDYIGGTHEVQLDLRFLVDHLAKGDKQADDYLSFGDRYDVSGQVITVRASLDGEIVDISIES
jgi:hypothetical protein